MDREYRDILHRCFRCGWCKLPTNYVDFNCPAYLKHRFESFSSGGRMWLIRAWQEGEIGHSDRLNEIIFSCVTCGNCVESCAIDNIRDKLVDIFIAARQELVDLGKIPSSVRDYFKAVSISGNPYKRPPEEAVLWTKGLDIERYDGQEYLLFAGDAAAFDDLGAKMCRATMSLLKRAGVSFGILGSEEVNDGNDIRAAGEKGLSESLARACIETFRSKRVKKIITISPHSFHTMRKDYPALGGDFEVCHYSQFLDALLSSRKIESGDFQAKVAYHDPCYLGRWNKEYLAPRRVLGSIRGVELREMNRSKQNALCCGGGGGNFFTDILGSGYDLSSRVRVREALDAGAEILTLSCPQCYRMLDDAVKAEGAQERLKLMDISEILAASIGS